MTPAAMVQLLLPRARALGPDDLYMIDGMLDLTSLFPICDLDRPELKYPALPPANARRSSSGSAPRHLPSRSATTTSSCTTPTTRSPRRSSSSSSRRPPIRRCSRSSKRCTAPAVKRPTSSRRSPRPRSAGKQVVVLVELTARGEEQAQRRLGPACSSRRACTSCTGSSASRRTPRSCSSCGAGSDGLRRYCHVGTGNYNVKTAHVRGPRACSRAIPSSPTTSPSCSTTSPGYSRPREYRRLLVAPVHLRGGVLER